MSSPVDIIANAIQAADRRVDGKRLAKVGADALVDRRILDIAVKALIADGWEETHEGPLGVGTLSHEDLRNIARTVLRSVSEPAQGGET